MFSRAGRRLLPWIDQIVWVLPLLVFWGALMASTVQPRP
jgi:hypothetical protein